MRGSENPEIQSLMLHWLSQPDAPVSVLMKLPFQLYIIFFKSIEFVLFCINIVLCSAKIYAMILFFVFLYNCCFFLVRCFSIYHLLTFQGIYCFLFPLLLKSVKCLSIIFLNVQRHQVINSLLCFYQLPCQRPLSCFLISSFSNLDS